jgi:hypothetical protein
MTPDNALRQASMTVHDYTMRAVTDLCDLLGIERHEKDWHLELAPFAPVLAAMITAAATDYDTAIRAGVVDDTSYSTARVDAEWERRRDNGNDDKSSHKRKTL